MVDLEFYLTRCQLETRLQEDATLYDLELRGTKQSPLDIFVIKTGLKYLATSNVYDKFGLPSGHFDICDLLEDSPRSHRTEGLYSRERIGSSLGGYSLSSGLDRTIEV